MTTGPSGKSGTPKRKATTTARNELSIRKLDQLRQMLDAVLDDPSRQLARVNPARYFSHKLPVKANGNGPTAPGDEEDESSGVSRFHSYIKQFAGALNLDKQTVLDRLTEVVLHNEMELKELCEHLSLMWDHYGAAISLIKDEAKDRPVTIRIGTTNLINMRVLPNVLQEVRRKFRKKYPKRQLRFTQTILDSDELLSETRPVVGVDVVVACCLDGRLRKFSPDELITSLQLRCCLLRQRTVDPAEAARSRSLRNWDDVPGTAMVALVSREKHFDVPWADIESWMESIEEVPTLLEAHARVAASDAWTLSYRELLDDVEEQRLEVFDLPPDSDRMAPWIVAAFPRKKQGRGRPNSTPVNGASNEKRVALDLLKSELQSAFERKKETIRQSEEMTQWLSRFQYSYHVSDYAIEGTKECRRTWFAGRANLEFTTNGNLSGVFTMGKKSMKVRVFGRPIPHNNRTLWHLQWRGVDQREESGTTNMVVKKSDLKEGDVLIGSWVGRSSWMADDVRPSGGPFILHTRPNLKPDELQELLLAHQAQCVPDLRQLSSEMISLPSEGMSA